MGANIAVFGGAFDPISLHHERIVEAVFEHTGMPTWVMPCWEHLFSKNQRLLAAMHRWNMVTVTAEQRRDTILVPFDWEISHNHTGSMYETMQQLRLGWPTKNFHIVIGMDNANIIEQKWDRGSLLIQEFPFLVFERTDVTPTATWFLEAPHRLFPLDYNLSSTAIRNAIEQGDEEFAQKHLNPAVWSYIKQAGFYRKV